VASEYRAARECRRPSTPVRSRRRVLGRFELRIGP
jgi:hypothetical protein